MFFVQKKTLKVYKKLEDLHFPSSVWVWIILWSWKENKIVNHFYLWNSTKISYFLFPISFGSVLPSYSRSINEFVMPVVETYTIFYQTLIGRGKLYWKTFQIPDLGMSNIHCMPSRNFPYHKHVSWISEHTLPSLCDIGSIFSQYKIHGTLLVCTPGASFRDKTTWVTHIQVTHFKHNAQKCNTI